MGERFENHFRTNAYCSPLCTIRNHRYIFSKGGESDVGLYVRPNIQRYIIKNDILVMSVFDVRVIAPITANNASKRNYVNEESV